MASYADTYPRTAYSEPAFPMMTRPAAMRGAPVIEYGESTGVVCAIHTGVPERSSSAMSFPTIVPT